MSLVKAKHLKFCDEYLIDLNGTQAAIRAGYSDKSAYSIASELLRRSDIIEYLEEQVSKQNELAFIERQKIILALKEIAYPDFSKPSSMLEITTSDRLKALMLIGKSLGMFWDKPQISEESVWVKKIKNAIERMNEGLENGTLELNHLSDYDSVIKKRF